MCIVKGCLDKPILALKFHESEFSLCDKHLDIGYKVIEEAGKKYMKLVYELRAKIRNLNS